MKRFWLFTFGLLATVASTASVEAFQQWNDLSTFGDPAPSQSGTDPRFFSPGTSSFQAPRNTAFDPGQPFVPQSALSGPRPQTPAIPTGYYQQQDLYGQAPGPEGLPSRSVVTPSLQPAVPQQPLAAGCDSYGISHRGLPASAGSYQGGLDYGCDSGLGIGTGAGIGSCGTNLLGGNPLGAACGDSRKSWFSHLSSEDRNLVGGVGGLVFFRDYEDDLGLSYDSVGGALFSTHATNDAMGGLEVFLQSRGCAGRGWEARYWGLYPNDSIAWLGGMPVTALGGLSQIWHAPTGQSALSIFNAADAHSVSRSNQFHNAEFSRLINAGTINGFRCQPVNYELLHGFRWFEFDESLEYSAYNNSFAPYRLDYNVRTDNTLLGYQVGGRTTRCLTNRLHLNSGLKFGLFNNRIRHRQFIEDDMMMLAEIYTGPSAGRPYHYTSCKNDLSTLTEAELGLAYLITRSLKISVGYRALGITGLALAPDQVPYNFTDANEIQRVRSNGSMILHGFQGGLSFCF